MTFFVNNPLTPVRAKWHLQILLCQTPDDFTRQRGTPRTERVNGRLSGHASHLEHDTKFTLEGKSLQQSEVSKMVRLGSKGLDFLNEL